MFKPHYMSLNAAVSLVVHSYLIKEPPQNKQKQTTQNKKDKDKAKQTINTFLILFCHD